MSDGVGTPEEPVILQEALRHESQPDLRQTTLSEVKKWTAAKFNKIEDALEVLLERVDGPKAVTPSKTTTWGKTLWKTGGIKDMRSKASGSQRGSIFATMAPKAPPSAHPPSVGGSVERGESLCSADYEDLGSSVVNSDLTAQLSTPDTFPVPRHESIRNYRLERDQQTEQNNDDTDARSIGETSGSSELTTHDEVEVEPQLMLPECRYITGVEIAGLLFAVVEYTVTTYFVCTYQIDRTPSGVELAILSASTLMYLVLIHATLITARLIGWQLIDDDKAAVQRLYVKSWFAFDVFVAIPYDLLMLGVSVNVFRITGLVRTLKMIRSISLFRTSNPLYDRRHVPLFCVVWIVCMHHTIACIHMMTAERNHNMGDYIESLYWAVQTTTSVGYGDVISDSTRMKSFSIVLMLIGSGFFGWFLGNISVYFMALDHVEQKEKHIKSMLLSLMKRYEVPLSVQKEAFCIYPFIFGEGATSNYAEILELFPPYMQNKIGIQIRLKLLRQVPMFQAAEGYILAKLAEKLMRIVLEPNMHVIEIGETGKEMFFIASGAVEVLVPVDGVEKQVVILQDGSWFGEIAILRETKRTAAVRTVTVCDLFMLTKEDFLNIFEMYPNSNFENAINEELDRRMAHMDVVKLTGSVATFEPLSPKMAPAPSVSHLVNEATFSLDDLGENASPKSQQQLQLHQSTFSGGSYASPKSARSQSRKSFVIDDEPPDVPGIVSRVTSSGAVFSPTNGAGRLELPTLDARKPSTRKLSLTLRNQACQENNRVVTLIGEEPCPGGSGAQERLRQATRTVLIKGKSMRILTGKKE